MVGRMLGQHSERLELGSAALKTIKPNLGIDKSNHSYNKQTATGLSPSVHVTSQSCSLAVLGRFPLYSASQPLPAALCLNALPSTQRLSPSVLSTGVVSSGKVFRPPHQGHRRVIHSAGSSVALITNGKFTLCCVDAYLVFDPLLQLVGFNKANLYPVLLTTESSLLNITLLKKVNRKSDLPLCK